ncbi:hypothetical protein TPA2_gp51 [Tsukamurella phage TPA2]|uniref:hypothetical protein n=1 Tax=Tsukamurella phage TPA2 TaxID=981330 RepID=UPI0001FF8DCA|nr:hypothetical protein TPA2_gp51 [Tsukamurella phage TPA2]ADX31965.1 hypothetical protein [Tsukamurella phage TPA2]
MFRKTLITTTALAALLIPAAPAFAEPGDSTGTDTGTSAETGGDRSLGDIIHDIFCPPEDDEEDEAEEPAATPEPPAVTFETPAKPTVNEKDDPVCSLDPESPNYCPPAEDEE